MSNNYEAGLDEDANEEEGEGEEGQGYGRRARVIRKASIRKDGWSQRGPVLTQVEQAVSQCHFQCDFSLLKFGGAGIWTIQFAVEPPIDPNPLFQGIYAAIIEVTWSVEGNSVRRQYSLVNGLSVSGAGQAIKMRVIDVTPLITLDSGATNTPGLEYFVSAQVVKGSRPSQNQPPTLTLLPAQDIAGHGTLVFQVPVDAGVISAKVFAYDEVTGVLSPLVSVQQQAGNATQVQAWYSPTIDNSFQPLVPGTTQLLISNGGADTISVAVIWGIDG